MFIHQRRPLGELGRGDSSNDELTLPTALNAPRELQIQGFDRLLDSLLGDDVRERDQAHRELIRRGLLVREQLHLAIRQGNFERPAFDRLENVLNDIYQRETDSLVNGLGSNSIWRREEALDTITRILQGDRGFGDPLIGRLIAQSHPLQNDGDFSRFTTIASAFLDESRNRNRTEDRRQLFARLLQETISRTGLSSERLLVSVARDNQLAGRPHMLDQRAWPLFRHLMRNHLNEQIFSDRPIENLPAHHRYVFEFAADSILQEMRQALAPDQPGLERRLRELQLFWNFDARNRFRARDRED